MNDSPTLVWTPRPPHPDEPACWSWPVPPVRTPDERRAYWEGVQALLPAGDRVDWETDLLDDAYDPRFLEFHAGRCALCGKPAGRDRRWQLVDDHCHRTGQIRGLLHMRCNSSEGRMRSPWPTVDRYRLVHPAAILDTHDMYDNDRNGWEWGWPLGQGPGDGSDRPATPWPAWDPKLLEV